MGASSFIEPDNVLCLVHLFYRISYGYFLFWKKRETSTQPLKIGVFFGKYDIIFANDIQ